MMMSKREGERINILIPYRKGSAEGKPTGGRLGKKKWGIRKGLENPRLSTPEILVI